MSEELELRRVEMEYHQKIQTIARREGALHTAHSMLQGNPGENNILDPKDVFKLAKQIIKFIEE